MASQAASKSISQGVVLADTYEITRRIGEGGMGVVWEARHRRLEGKHVAIKVLHPDVAAEAESVARFRREAQIASRLGHPNIVEVYDFNTLPDGTEYLILELLRGESLAARLVRGPLPAAQVFDITRQIASALQAAHSQGIIHRDLKPQNIFLCPTEARGYVTEQAKVLDFGISKIRGSQTIKTQATSMLGTPQYMAPEQATGNHDAVDGRTDVFALGSMVYEMLSGKPAFTGTTIPEVVFKVVYEPPVPLSERAPHLSAAVVDAVHRALEKNQADRFPDVSAFVEALTGDPLRTFRGLAGATEAGDDARTGALATGDTAYAPITAPGFAPGAGDIATAHTITPAPGTAGTGRGALAAEPHTGNRDEAAFAQTMASGDYARELIQPSGEAAPVPQRPEQTSPGPSPAKSPTKWIVLAGAAVVAAVAITVAVMQSRVAGLPAAARAVTDAGPERPRADSGRGAASAVGPAGDAGPSETQASREDAAAATPSAGTRGNAGSESGKPAGGEPESGKPASDNSATKPRRGTPDTGGVSAETRALAKKDLDEAKALARAGEPDRAIIAARRSLGRVRTDGALALLTRIYCARRDLGNAKPYFDQIRSPRTRRSLAKECMDRDIELED